MLPERDLTGDGAGVGDGDCAYAITGRSKIPTRMANDTIRLSFIVFSISLKGPSFGLTDVLRIWSRRRSRYATSLDRLEDAIFDNVQIVPGFVRGSHAVGNSHT